MADKAAPNMDPNDGSPASSHPGTDTADDPKHSVYDDDDNHSFGDDDDGNNDDDDDEQWDQFQFSTFVGREDELERLNSIYGRICRKPLTKHTRDDSSSADSNKDAQVVLIHGYSGTGKSALVDRFLHRLNDGATKSPSPPPSSPPSQTATSAIAHSVQDESPMPSNKRRADSHPCHYGKGKYDQFNAGGNLSAIVDALSHFFRSLVVSGDTEECDRIRMGLNRKMDATRRMLACRAIPGLASLLKEHRASLAGNAGNVVDIATSNSFRSGRSGELLREEQASVSAGSIASGSVMNTGAFSHAGSKTNEWVQLVYSFKIILKAICTDGRPLVLYLDDLQWVDERSLKLITEVLIDQSIRNLLIIGSYRSNEVHNDPQHQLTTAVSQWKNNGKTIHDIPLNDLTVTQTAELLASSLRLDAVKTTPLAKLLHDKTKGNVLYTMQALEGLRRRKALTRNIYTMQWEWDEQRAADEIDMAANVVDLITSKLHSLPEDLQRCLQMASFLRSTFRQSLLETLMDMEIEHQQQKADGGGAMRILAEADMSVGDALNLAVKEELLERLDVDTATAAEIAEGTVTSCATFRFVHDRIQQAAFSLTPPGDELDQLKYRVGKHLMEIASDPMLGEDWMWFVAADHLENASSLTTTNTIIPELDLIKLNLKVGQLAVGVAAFLPAMKYLNRALTNLEVKIADPWKTQHELCLETYHRLSEVELTLGNYEKGSTLCQAIVDNCNNSIEDIVKANTSLAVALERMERHGEACDLHLRSLKLLGTFPMRNHLFLALRDFRKLKKYFAKHTDEEVLNLPVMTDPKMLMTMKILQYLGSVAFLAARDATLLLAGFRQVTLMLKHGLSGEGAYGAYLTRSVALHVMKDVKFAKRLQTLPARILATTHSKYVMCQFFVADTGFLAAWSEPVHVCLAAYQKGHQAGMEAGDLSHAYRCWGMCLLHGFMCGVPLVSLHRAVTILLVQAEHYNLKEMSNSYGQVQRFFEILLGMSSARLQGEVIREQSGEQSTGHWKDRSDVPSAKDMDREQHIRWGIWYWCYEQLTMYFGELELGKICMGPSKASAGLDNTFVRQTVRVFQGGLTMSRMAQKTDSKRKRRKYHRKAANYTAELRRLVERNGGNNLHRYLIMEADKMAVRGKQSEQKVKAAYDKAISYCARSGHVNDAALANELAAEYFLNKHTGTLALSGSLRRTTLSDPSRSSDFESAGVLDDDEDFYWPRQYLGNAISLYNEWGARAKVEQMLAKYPNFLDRSMLEGGTDSGDGETNGQRRKRRPAKHTADTRMCVATAHKIMAEVNFDAL